jgi:hypothetical protein
MLGVWVLIMVTTIAERNKYGLEETGLRWCVNVVRIAMPSVLGFHDGSHYAEKRTNVV